MAVLSGIFTMHFIGLCLAALAGLLLLGIVIVSVSN